MDDPFGWNFNTQYTDLPEAFYRFVSPEKAPDPHVVCFNEPLAAALALNHHQFADADRAELFSGNRLPAGCQPFAQSYAGHQFGHFTMLGDGRAHLMGEHVTPAGGRFDIQLKGSGRTPYSRRGDGKATLRSMLREYLISESLHLLNIATSRSLAVVATGEKVNREQAEAGAVLTRVMQSHLRVGTFEFARQFTSEHDLQALLNYAISRHYPDLKGSDQAALAFVQRVMERQIDLVVEWMRVGFIHGVMNTDNMSIGGETFDYGPCAFMNRYHPDTVFSSIDTQGRYRFARQPIVVHWNLSCLAGALLPLMDASSDVAVEKAQELLNGFPELFEARYAAMMRGKLGLTEPHLNDADFFNELLKALEQTQTDYTNFFAKLRGDVGMHDIDFKQEAFEPWFHRWSERVAQQPGGRLAAEHLMRKSNPVIIPRNHLVEEALDAGVAGDLTLMTKLLEAMSETYQGNESPGRYAIPPVGGDQCYKTYCGT